MLQSVSDISHYPEVIDIIKKALAEDIGTGDHSSLAAIQPNRIATARLIFKDTGIAAGLKIAYTILKLNDNDCIVTELMHDGDLVKYGDIGFEVTGNAHGLLKSERLLLNIMQRLSGIASITKIASNKIQNYATKILDTRKTTPNLRILEKWAVTVGGGYNHRIGLYDMIMLKDNHVDVAGGIVNAIQKAKAYLLENNLSLGIEVETRTLEEVKEALTQIPFQRIMLDNFSPETTKEAVKLIDNQCETEASGGITLDNIEKYAEAGVNFISLGMLTHSVKSLDISFKIKL
ncbi:MAG: carboxylating nicotinate-nucleotide diphosphorylase [bacterium]|nr:carboxylating nicotinate-nucleotide diphosphorylase [bacterium]